MLEFATTIICKAKQKQKVFRVFSEAESSHWIPILSVNCQLDFIKDSAQVAILFTYEDLISNLLTMVSNIFKVCSR